MGKLLPISPIHWGLFHSLESDLIELSKSIELIEENYGVYSIKLTRLLLSVGAEVDSVAKKLCHKIDPGSSPQNINQYAKIILAKFPSINELTVCFSRYNVEVIPWEIWSPAKSPAWWKGHNKVKHDRSLNYLLTTNPQQALIAAVP